MKKLLLLTKTLLAAALLCVGQNAWGEETVLLPTGGVTTITKNSSDVAYNSEATSWTINQGVNKSGGSIFSKDGPYCYVKFDASDITGTITEAVLSFDIASSAYNTSYDVFLLGAADWDATTAAYTTLSSGAKSGTNIANGTWSTKNVVSHISYTITSNVSKSLMGLGICCSTGRAQSISNIKLTINHTTAAVYTATFTETNSLKPTVTIYTDAGRTETITNGSLLDKTTYYYRATLHGYVNYEGSFTVNGANPSVNFTMTAAEAVESLKVYARISDKNYLIKTIDLDDNYIGDVITITYPRLWLVGTTLYSTAQQAHGSDYFRWSYTLDGNDAVIEYNTTEATGVVYYSEGEDIEGMTEDASGNADIRCSGGKGGRSADELSLTTLGTGVYKLTSRVWGGKDYTYTYRAAGTDVLAHTTTGALSDNNVSFNVVSGTAAIKVQGVNTGGRVLDYVYIQKLDDATVSVYNGDFENSTWDKGWLGTGSDKAKAFAKQTSSQTWGAEGNFAEMWTNTSFSVEANLRQILVNVPAGNYILSADILNSVASSGGVIYAKVGSASDVTTAAVNAAGANESVSFTVAETSNVVLGFKTTAISSKSGWIAIDNFVLKQVVSGTITPAGWASFSSTLPLDLSTLTATSGATAYYASEATGSTVTLSTTTATVPAGEGIMIKGTPNETFTINVAASGEAIDGNLLKGQTTTGNVAASTDDVKHYVFGYVTETPTTFGFYNLASVTSVEAGKAYLEINNGVSTARALRIVFGDITGVDNVEAASEAKAQDGKFIENGKLVIVKNGVKYNAAGQQVK